MYKKIILFSLLILITFLFSACQLKRNNKLDESFSQDLTTIETNESEESSPGDLNIVDPIDCGEVDFIDIEPAKCFFRAINNNCSLVKIKSPFLNQDYDMHRFLNPEAEKKYSYISSELLDDKCYINIIEDEEAVKCLYNKDFLEEELNEQIQYYIQTIINEGHNEENTKKEIQELLREINGGRDIDEEHDYENYNDLRLKILYDLIIYVESRQGYDDCYWIKDENNNSGSNWRILSDKNTNHDMSFSNDYLYVLRSLGVREKNDYFIVDKYKDGVIVESIETPKFNLVHENSWPKIFVDSFENIFIYNLNMLYDLNTEGKLFLDFTQVAHNSNLLYYNKQQDKWQIFEDKNGAFGNINAMDANSLGVWMALAGGKLYLYNYNTWEEHVPWKLGINESRVYANVSANNDYIVLFSDNPVVDIYKNGQFTTSSLPRTYGRYEFDFREITKDNEIYFLNNDELNKFSLDTKNTLKIDLPNDVYDCVSSKTPDAWCYGSDEHDNFIIYRYNQETWSEHQFLNLSYPSPRKLIATANRLYILTAPNGSVAGSLYELSID